MNAAEAQQALIRFAARHARAATLSEQQELFEALAICCQSVEARNVATQITLKLEEIDQLQATLPGLLK
jgi:hypothetical protein